MHSTTSLNLSTPTLTAFLSATATAIAAVQDGSRKGSAATGPYDHPPANGECKLLGSFALLVQAALGGCAVLALVYKRWRERPQRPMKIWFFDVSKQVVGSALVHVANIFMSMLSSGKFTIKAEPRSFNSREHYEPNPCSFYLLNLAIDTTIGIPILIVILRVLTALFSMTPFGQPTESIQSGNYGSPPRAGWWAKQSFIYFIGLLLMKICVLVIFLVLPWISQVGDWALKWTEGNETLQVIFVMLFFPLVMNATQYYIIDSFIKKQESAGGDVMPTLDDADERGPGAFEERMSDEIDEDDDENAEGKKPFLKKSSRKSLSSKTHDYDPDRDGENSPTTGSGSGSDRGTPRFKNGNGDVADEGKLVGR